MATTAVKTIDDLVAEVRDTVNDARVPYRYSDAAIVRYINTALRELYRLRPDAWIGFFSTGVLTSTDIPTYETADLGTAVDFPVDDKLFFNAVAFFVIGRIEMADDEFVDDSRARTLLQAFAQMVGG